MSQQSFPPIAYVLLISLAAIWGASFLFIKMAVVAIPPLTLVAARLVLAAAAMLVYMWATGRRLPSDKAIWWDFLVIALAGNIVPFILISWGEVVIDSGLAAILMAIMPLSSLALAHVFTRDERLSPARVMGMIVGFVGILVLVGPDVLAGLGREVLAQIAVASAAVCYAISNVYTRVRGVVELPAAVTSAGVLLCASVLAVPLSLIVDRPWTLVPTAESLAALVILALVCTSLAYLILFHLITTTGATFVAFINYLVPVFGVAWGAVILHETVQPGAMAGLAIILAGIAISRYKPRQHGQDTGDSR
jgi:drug/metabolite transporter (DMT)-like permease